MKAAENSVHVRATHTRTIVPPLTKPNAFSAFSRRSHPTSPKNCTKAINFASTEKRRADRFLYIRSNRNRINVGPTINEIIYIVRIPGLTAIIRRWFEFLSARRHRNNCDAANDEWIKEINHKKRYRKRFFGSINCIKNNELKSN